MLDTEHVGHAKIEISQRIRTRNLRGSEFVHRRAEFVGAYPLRYLNFCLTNVSGAYLGESRGLIFLSFEIRAERI